MSSFKNRVQMAGKIEALEGTAEALTAAEAFLAFNPGWDPTIGRYQAEPCKATGGQIESQAGERSSKISFTAHLTPSGTPGTPPWWGKYVKACGAQEIITLNTSVEYKPATLNAPSMTLGRYTGTRIKHVWGCRGDLKIALDKGKPPLGTFTFTGKDFSVIDGGFLAGVDYSAMLVQPSLFLGAAFLFDAYQAIISKLEFALGNNIVLPDDAGQASGFRPTLISNRKPTISFDPEAVAVATKDFYGKWRGSSGAAMSCTLGSTPGHIIAFSASKAQVEDLKSGDRKEILIDQITCSLKETNGDDDWSILLT